MKREIQTIKFNNFIGNTLSVKFDCIFFQALRTRWIGNYWDDWDGIVPKYIEGTLYIIKFGYEPEEILIPWTERDWFPRKEPYDIDV